MYINAIMLQLTMITNLKLFENDKRLKYKEEN